MPERAIQNLNGPARLRRRSVGSGVPKKDSFIKAKPTYEELAARVRELEAECLMLKNRRPDQKELEKKLSDALTKILSGYLPICARCKRIRQKDGSWTQIESYIQAHTQAVFSHSLCSKCAKSFYPEFFEPEE